MRTIFPARPASGFPKRNGPNELVLLAGKLCSELNRPLNRQVPSLTVRKSLYLADSKIDMFLANRLDRAAGKLILLRPRGPWEDQGCHL